MARASVAHASQAKKPRFQTSTKPKSPLEAFGGGADHLHMFLEAIILASGVGLRRCGLADKMTEIDKMFMAGGALGEVGSGPFLNEIFGSHWSGRTGHGHILRRTHVVSSPRASGWGPLVKGLDLDSISFGRGEG